MAAKSFWFTSHSMFNWVPNQALRLYFNGFITLTGAIPQALQIDQPDVPAPIIDEASLLQRAGDNRHAGTSDT
jgi:hypothetical protein